MFIEYCSTFLCIEVSTLRLMWKMQEDHNFFPLDMYTSSIKHILLDWSLSLSLSVDLGNRISIVIYYITRARRRGQLLTGAAIFLRGYLCDQLHLFNDLKIYNTCKSSTCNVQMPFHRRIYLKKDRYIFIYRERYILFLLICLLCGEGLFVLLNVWWLAKTRVDKH